MSETLPARSGKTREDLAELVAEILSHAKKCGATQAAAAVSQDAGLSATCRLGEVETIEYQRDRGLGVTVFFGHRKGTASTADLERSQIAATVEKACSIAKYTKEDEYSGLADPDRMPDSVPDLDLCHPWQLSPEEAIDLALQCEKAALEFDERIANSEGATVSLHDSLRVYGNSHGFIGGYPTTSHSISCSVVAKDDNAMERDYWYTASRVPTLLEDPKTVGQTAAKRTVGRLGARQISTRKTPVIFPPELARGFIGHCVGALSGSSQYREASFLLGAQGTQVFPDFFTCTEQPHVPQAIGSAPFDNEGVATQDRVLIDQGVIQGYVLSSYSARKLGLETTGNAGGIHNLTVQGSEENLDQLIAKMGTGFFVTELIGHGVNLVTGDYSRGAAGFWIENGSIVHAVNEVTIAGNLKDLYANIVAVGNDLDTRGSLRCGSLFLEEMTVAGN